METRTDRLERAKATETDTMGFLLLLSTGLSGVGILISLCLTFAFFGLANKPQPALVQLNNGSTIDIKAQQDKERDPIVIQRFIESTLGSMFTWSGYLPPQNMQEATNPKLDPGVDVPGKAGGKVPTAAWQNSFALSSDFQNPFLQQISLLTQKFGALQGQPAQSILNIEHMGIPVKVESGSWKVGMVATLKIIQQGAVIKQVAFNKEIFVRAVNVPLIPQGLTANKGQSAIAELNARLRASGLEIYAMREYQQPDLKPVPSANPVP
jgi:hypothetical protein